MGDAIRWLHLTDLHVGMDDQDWLWPRMRGKFHEDLRKIHDEAGPWDLVLFSGDLVQKGSEYARLDEILGELWEWFGELGSRPKLLTVPGNHDLQWRDAKSPVVKTLYRWSTDADVREEFWKESNEQYLPTIQEAFADYDAWWKNTRLKPDNVEHGFLPGDFSYTFTKGDLRLGIVGLNSAFLQLTEKRSGGFRGKLVVDPRQFHRACGGDGVKWANSRDACFLMTHHPPEWLNKESRDRLGGEIMESFCLHLCGHNHETDVLQELTGGAGYAPLRWLGRSLFGLEKAASGKLDRSHGYVAGELRAEGEKGGELQFMPRTRVQQGAKWSLVPDHEVELPDDRCTREFPVHLRQVDAGAKSRFVRGATSTEGDAESVDAVAEPAAESAVDDSTDETSLLEALVDGIETDVEEVVTEADAESKSSEGDAKRVFIANELLQVVCEQLNSESESFSALRAELIAALADEGRDEREVSVDFLARALAKQLNQVMSTLRIWLDSTHSVEGKEELRQLIDAVATAGFEADWIEELLDEFEALHMHVPIETDLYLCEVIFTALYRKPATWIRDKEIDHNALQTIATPATKPAERAREIRRRLVETHFKDRISREVGESDGAYQQRLDKWAERDLPGVLETEREDQKPWFVLFLETVDALKNDMAIDHELWSHVLKLERTSDKGRFVCNRGKLQDRLIEMNKRLDELDPGARGGHIS